MQGINIAPQGVSIAPTGLNVAPQGASIGPTLIAIAPYDTTVAPQVRAYLHVPCLPMPGLASACCGPIRCDAVDLCCSSLESASPGNDDFASYVCGPSCGLLCIATYAATPQWS